MPYAAPASDLVAMHDEQDWASKEIQITVEAGMAQRIFD